MTIEEKIYNKYENKGNEALKRFKHYNQLDTIADGDITKYNKILDVDYATILIYTDLQLAKLQIQEQRAEANKHNNK